MEMRDLMNKMRNYNNDNKKVIPNKPLSKDDNVNVREMLKRTKKAFLNEDDSDIKNDDESDVDTEDEPVEKTLDVDQEKEEEKFRNYFRDLEIVVDFIEIEVYETGVFWGGTIDGIIQFVYKVTPNEKDSGYEVYYLEDFDKNNPDNEEIVNRIESYYNEFFKYWRDNFLKNW